MPWCETCDKFHNPGTIDATGICSGCGTVVEVGELAQHVEEESVKVPWHFWVGVAAVIGYLGWRLIQGVGLLFW